MPPSSPYPAKTGTPLTPGADLKSDARWQLVERILQTPPFQKSANLYALLLYLAEHSIRGQLDALTERQIGMAAFGKPEGYSPAEDSAVRVHVRQLRLRLHEYFACEGRNETLHVEIPKGSYLLEFRAAQVESPRPAPQPPAPVAAPAPPPKAKRSRARDILLWIAVAAAIVCAAGWYRSAAGDRAASQVPWPLNAVIAPNQQTRVVVSDANSMLRLLSQKEFTLDQYLQPDFRQSLTPQHLDPGMARLVDYISTSQLTSFADLVVASTLVKVAGRSGVNLEITPAQNLNLRDLEDGNDVFVGSPLSNPWVSLFADKLNFVAVEDTVGGKMYFRNKKPLAGEQATYEGLPKTGSAGEEYASISVLPGNSGRGRVLILQGLRQEGTEALGELLQNPDNRKQLERALLVSDDAHAPTYFEALIRARAVAGAPVSIQIVATRSSHG